MKARKVVLAPEAADDLHALIDWIADEASVTVAMGYLARIELYIRGLSVGSERGHLRSDIRPGLRIVGFERRVTIAFSVQEHTVTVLRLFSAGRDWEGSF